MTGQGFDINHPGSKKMTFSLDLDAMSADL
jgi:hypothetical protein